jgi:hypothetical protein
MNRVKSKFQIVTFRYFLNQARQQGQGASRDPTMVLAAEKIGRDGKGKDGGEGFVEYFSRKQKEALFNTLPKLVGAQKSDDENAGGHATIIINQITVKQGDQISPLDGVTIVSHEVAHQQYWDRERDRDNERLRPEPEVAALIEKAIKGNDDEPDASS